MDAGGAGLLRDAADIVLDLLARDHHQVSQLVNDDGDIGQVLHAGLGGQLVVSLDLADVVLGKELVAALHLGHAGPQRTGSLARLGDDGHQQVRNAVVLGQLDDLRVDQNELDILGAGAEQEADDNGVDADGFTAAGGTGNQQVGHLAEICDLRRTGNVLAEGHRQRAAHVDIILGFKDCADVDGGADFVRNLDADGGLAGDGRFDAYTRGGQVQGDVVGQACDAADLDTGLGL